MSEQRTALEEKRFEGRRWVRFLGLGLAILIAASVSGIGWIVAQDRAFETIDLSTVRPAAFDRLDRAEPGLPYTSVRAVQPANLQPANDVGRIDSQTRVAILGDSWVSKGKLTAPVTQGLQELGLPQVEVRSFGHPGATSRRILRNLFAAEDEEFSSADVLNDPDIRLAVVIAGVNDSAGHKGQDFYVHHVVQIVRTLHRRGIQPLLLELPEYGIEESHAAQSGPSWLKSELFVQFFDGGKVDIIDDYRTALRKGLSEAGLLDGVRFIDFEPVASDYQEDIDLYQNPSHLNKDGQKLLASLVASAVADQLDSPSRNAPRSLEYQFVSLP